MIIIRLLKCDTLHSESQFEYMESLSLKPDNIVSVFIASVAAFSNVHCSVDHKKGGSTFVIWKILIDFFYNFCTVVSRKKCFTHI